MINFWKIWKAELISPDYDFAQLINALDDKPQQDSLTIFNIEDFWDLKGIKQITEKGLSYKKFYGTNWLKPILRPFSQYGMTGYIHYVTEEGAHHKIVLDGKGDYRIYFAKYVFDMPKGEMLVKKDYLRNIIIEYYRRALAHENKNWEDMANGFEVLGYALFPREYDRIKGKLITEAKKSTDDYIEE